jgi:hypothetical protein
MLLAIWDGTSLESAQIRTFSSANVLLPTARGEEWTASLKRLSRSPGRGEGVGS